MTLLILRDLSVYGVQAVPDPDLRENGGEGGKQSPQKIFGPFEPHLGPKIRGGGRPPGPSPGSATIRLLQRLSHMWGWSSFCNLLHQCFFVYPQGVHSEFCDAWSRLAGLIYYVLFFELVEALFFGWELLSRFSDGGQGSLPIKPLPSPPQWSQTFQDKVKETLYI